MNREQLNYPRRRMSLMHALVICMAFALTNCEHQHQANEEVPAIVFSGVGGMRHPIGTGNGKCQQYFDQGLAFIYGFDFGEAIQSFKRAAELDPNTPMPYWGIALANGPNYNLSKIDKAREIAAFDAIQTAVGISSNAPEEERDLISALEHEFSDADDIDQAHLLRSYATAMREVYRKNPDDPDVATLFAGSLMNINAWHLWTPEGIPRLETIEAISVLEEALRRWPEHPGANHFYIHAMESSPFPERALASAMRLPALAPMAGHLVHMPSHIYMRTGDYAAAVRSNQDAVKVDRQYFQMRPTPPPGTSGYRNHNLHYLAAAASMDGEFDVAFEASTELTTRSKAEHFLFMPLVILARFAQYDRILATSEPGANGHGVRLFWRYARSFAFAQKGRTAEAESERAAMREEYLHLPAGRAFMTMTNDWATLYEIADEVVRARIAWAKRDTQSAIAHWISAVDLEDKLNLDELPDWYYPVRESLGAALLQANRACEAEKVFREDLRKNPRNPRSLYGLAKALEAQGNGDGARNVIASFVEAWKGRITPDISDF